jgi:hypothetical protein
MPDGFGIDAQLSVIADADDDADADADAGDRFCVVRGFPLAGSGVDLMNLFGRNLRTKLN